MTLGGRLSVKQTSPQMRKWTLGTWSATLAARRTIRGRVSCPERRCSSEEASRQRDTETSTPTGDSAKRAEEDAADGICVNAVKKNDIPEERQLRT